MANYNDKVIIPGRYNVVKFDQDKNIVQVITLNDPHWLETYGQEYLKSRKAESEWASMVWDAQDDDDCPEENDPVQTFRWAIIGPKGKVINKGYLKTWDQNGDCISLE